MQIYPAESGTHAIRLLAQSGALDSLVVPGNMCPEVVTSLSRDLEVILAPMTNHMEDPNYELSAVDAPGSVGALFLHPYGRINASRRKALDETGRFSLIIDDLCLADPLTAIQYAVDQQWNAVFSFGYSKVIDLAGGGLCVTTREIDAPQSTVIQENERYGMSLPPGLHIQAADPEEFFDSNFWMTLCEITELRNRHRHCIMREFEPVVLERLTVVDSPWRLVLMMKADVLSHFAREVSQSSRRLFFGRNYPLLSRDYDGSLRLQYVDAEDQALVNIFTDFRVCARDAYAISNCLNISVGNAPE